MTQKKVKITVPWFQPEISADEIQLVTGVLKSNYINDGDVTTQFENILGKKLQVKHVVCVTSGTMALYAAMKSMGIGAGDEVIAHPTTITGSIGVIIQTFNFSEGMRKIGINADAVTSGPNKAAGSPFEPMPAKHRALLQELVDEFYSGFVSVVKKSRPTLSPEDLKWITDGRVVTGRRAAEIGLVDSTGDLHDAFAAAKRRANLSRAKLVKYHRNSQHVGSAYARQPQIDPQINLLQLNVNAGSMFNQSGFYYLWDPTVW